jgi:hypothetical protein
MAAIRYNIIRLEVERPGQIIRFQHKIPSNLKRCTGFKAVHVTGIQTDLYIPEIGWFTISFNSLKEEAIVSPVSVQAFMNPEVSPEFQTLNVKLKANQLVVGVYVDTKKTNGFYPYMVSFYLRCTENLEDAKAQIPSKKAKPSTDKADTIEHQCQDEDDELDIEIDEENPDQLCSTT